MTPRARLLTAVLLYPAWLLFQAVHEAGHVLHAVVSGGHVAAVQLPLVGFSRTVLAANPHPLFVVAGGPLWGAAGPLLAACFLSLRRPAIRRAAQAFAVFCLIGNGAYVAVGWIEPAGDGADLLRLGAPAWALELAGSAVAAGGLWLWHDLGLAPAQRRRAAE